MLPGALDLQEDGVSVIGEQQTGDQPENLKNNNNNNSGSEFTAHINPQSWIMQILLSK